MTDRARPGLVALYDIRPGNVAGQFLQPRSRTGLMVLWMMEVVVTAGAISRAKLQSNHHHQQTNIQFFIGPSCRPTNSVKALKGKDLCILLFDNAKVWSLVRNFPMPSCTVTFFVDNVRNFCKLAAYERRTDDKIIVFVARCWAVAGVYSQKQCGLDITDGSGSLQSWSCVDCDSAISPASTLPAATNRENPQ